MREELDLGSIRAFVAVVDNGDFTAAGRKLGMSRSAVGKAVIRLEGHLGARLLHRSTRSVSLTTDGSLFYERCVQVLADLADAEASVRQDRQEPRGQLKLSLPGAYGRLRIVPILQEYLTRWPKIRAEVHFSDRIVDIVSEGFDLAIRIGGAESSAGLITRVVDRIDGVICAAPAYLAARGVPDHPDAIQEHDQLVFGLGGQLMPWAVNCADSVFRPTRSRARLVADSADALRMAALAGLGIANLPHALVAPDLAAGNLMQVLSDFAAGPIPVHALYPDRRYLPARARLLIDLIAERLA
jgi:DNA-binding transcriptional LysR family regulator